MQMRVNAESAAFYNAGKIEKEKTNRYLDKLLSTQKRLYIREYALNCKLEYHCIYMHVF